MKVESVSIYTALADFYEDNNITQSDVNESLLLKWTDEVTESIITDQQLIPKISWVPVSNYKAYLKDQPQIFLEVAYRLEPSTTSCKNMGYQIVQWAEQLDDGCTLEYNLDCPECDNRDCNCADIAGMTVDITRSWEISHPEAYYSNYVKVGRFGYGNSVYTDQFKILTYSDNAWQGLNKHLPGCAMIYCKNCPQSYTWEPPFIETSFEKGELLISYLGKKRDENGNIMIPKHRYVFEAILEHLTYKYYRMKFLDTGGNIERNIYTEARANRDLAIYKANAVLGMPSFEEFSKFYSINKWQKIDNAYENLLNGDDPYVTIDRGRNIYKT